MKNFNILREEKFRKHFAEKTKENNGYFGHFGPNSEFDLNIDFLSHFLKLIKYGCIVVLLNYYVVYIELPHIDKNKIEALTFIIVNLPRYSEAIDNGDGISLKWFYK